MHITELLSTLRAGRTVIGTLIVSPSPRWPDAVRQCGLDFVFMDTEHIALDRAQLSWMCQTYAALGLAPIVRIPSPSPYEATVALDGGAAGVVAPYIETAAQARELRGAVKLRPLKGERLRNILAGTAHPEPDLEATMKRGAAERMLILNIESVPAMNALDEILAVPGIDALLIGPHDLSCSLGMPEQYSRPEFLHACKTIFHKARAAASAPGIHFWGTAEEQANLLKLGANFLIHSGDITLFQKHCRLEIEAVKKAAALEQKSGADAEIINV